MKKIGLVLVIGMTGLALLWLAVMSLTNTSLTRLEVRVSGSVDGVSFFRSDDPSNPVAVIQTNGVDTAQVVKLRSSESFSLFYQTPPSSYTFSTRIGDTTFRGKKICCESGLFTHRSLLTISGPSEWQIVDE